jgi:membrane-bound lytic murein transglycosylase D
MTGKLAYILVAVPLALAAAGCVQSIDAQSDAANQIAISGSADARPVSGPLTKASDPTDSILLANDIDPLVQPYTGAMAGSLPFVRSQPKGVAPFPIELSAAVKRYVDAYAAQPQGLQESFRRSRPYMAEMAQVMRGEGLPNDLIYLSFAESQFCDDGDGPWQLSKETAQRFGLIVNDWIDERRDPIQSTRAAAEYLALLHDEAGSDWRVAVAAWNNGDALLSRYLRMRQAGYQQLAARLPERTRALINRFLAVDEIAHNAEQYGLESVNFYERPHYKLVEVKGGVLLSHIASAMHTSLESIREANPALLKDRIPPGLRSYQIRIPDPELASALSEL